MSKPCLLSSMVKEPWSMSMSLESAWPREPVPNTSSVSWKDQNILLKLKLENKQTDKESEVDQLKQKQADIKYSFWCHRNTDRLLIKISTKYAFLNRSNVLKTLIYVLWSTDSEIHFNVIDRIQAGCKQFYDSWSFYIL